MPLPLGDSLWLVAVSACKETATVNVMWVGISPELDGRESNPREVNRNSSPS